MTHTLILTTCPDRTSAEKLANTLVSEGLAACVQRFPVESIYLWQDKICNDNEIVLLIKTKAELFERISACIQENHPYELPEIIRLPITDGLPGYLRWIDDCTM